MESVDRTKHISLSPKVVVLAFGVCLLGACSHMTTYVNVSHEPETGVGAPPVTMELVYQGSVLDHHGTHQVLLNENPKRVKFYNAPVVVLVTIGDQGIIDLSLPSARSWGRPMRFDDSRGGGWVTIEGREMCIHFAHPTRADESPAE